jgi:predicted metal-dependent hydrolase
MQKLNQAIKSFNQADYYKSHELLEEIWIELEGDEKKYFQAFIQLVVVLHLIQCKRLVGAQKVFLRAQNNLLNKHALFNSFLDKIPIIKLNDEVRIILERARSGFGELFEPHIEPLEA